MRQAMSADQYRKALKHYDISAEHAARLFNGTPGGRSGRRWALAGAPFHVALLFTLMHQLNITPDAVEAAGHKWRKQLQTNGD